MTLIVGIEHEGAAYMGADSGFWSNSLEDANVQPKLFTLGPLLVGCAGTLRVSNIVRYGIEDLPPVEGADCLRYIVREFVPRMRAAVLEGGAMERDGDQCDRWGGNLLIACGGELYSLSGYFCAMRNTRGYASAGHDLAQAVASGVLASTPNRPPAERIGLALRTAEDHTDVVRAPYVLEVQQAPSQLAAVA